MENKCVITFFFYSLTTITNIYREKKHSSFNRKVIDLQSEEGNMNI